MEEDVVNLTYGLKFISRFIGLFALLLSLFWQERMPYMMRDVYR